ncbi:MAG: hypothetical protein H6728_13440 [Myxococcales bacterium]|nr:hypothetical protein [Myxococcales bacterium]
MKTSQLSLSRHLGALAFVALWTLSPNAQAAPPTYLLKSYVPKKGETYKVHLKQQQSMLTTTKKGQVLQRREMNNESFFEETVLAVKDGQISERLRVYKRCIAYYLIVRGNRKRSLPWTCGLVGRQIVLKGVRGLQVQIIAKDKKPISPRDRVFLRRSLAQQQQKRLFPQTPLPVGGIWKINMESLLRQLPFPRNTIDLKKVRAEGKLIKIHPGTPLQATLYMDLVVPLTAFPRYKEVKGQIILHSEGKGAIDGQSPILDNLATTTIQLEGIAQYKRGNLATKTVIRSRNHRKVTR